MVFDPTDPRQVVAPNELAKGELDVILVLNEQVEAIASDDQRLFWSAYGMVQSCEFERCVDTFVTYVDNHCTRREFAVHGGLIVWVQRTDCDWATNTWELRGNSTVDPDPIPRLLMTGTVRSFAMSDRLYWWTNEVVPSLQRCAPESCAETQETIFVLEDLPPGGFFESPVLSDTHAYWLEGKSERDGTHMVRRVALDAGHPQIETLVESETFLKGLSLRDGRLYWAVNNFLSPIQSCDVEDCVATTSPVVANQDYPSWTATTKGHLLWVAGGELRACDSSNCEATLETIAKNPLMQFATDQAVYYAKYLMDGSGSVLHRRSLP